MGKHDRIAAKHYCTTFDMLLQQQLLLFHKFAGVPFIGNVFFSTNYGYESSVWSCESHGQQERDVSQ